MTKQQVLKPITLIALKHFYERSSKDVKINLLQKCLGDEMWERLAKEMNMVIVEKVNKRTKK